MVPRQIPLLPVALLAAVVAGPLAAQKAAPAPASAYDTALARYRECMRRLPFRFHTEGRERLAETRRAEALQLLVTDYAESKDHPEYTRYTLAALFGRNFQGPEFAPTLAALCKQCGKPVDTWLWVNALRASLRGAMGDDVLAVVKDDKNALHRAAAIVALGQTHSPLLAQALTWTCLDFPPKDKEADRNALIGAMSGAILENRARANDEEFRKGLTAYIELLAPATRLTHVVMLQMARHLQWTLNGPAQFVDPESWLELLAHGEVKQPTRATTVTHPRFFGIESEGERLCYVLDMSDSMLKEITPNMKPPAATGPITGPGAPKKKKEKGAVPDESDLPWDKIKTRWDLLREELRISLQRLPQDKYFSVVWFGDESGTFDSCKGMTRATRANVDRLMAELDAFPFKLPNKLTADELKKAPDGILRGNTNMHSGLKRAFGLHNKGFAEEVGYVDPAALTEGCDTIFMLSDGAPSWDDFWQIDKDYGEGDVVIDTEYGTKVDKRPPQLKYHGPYDQNEWLIEDVTRMNAFRRVRIHCIGIGEASMDLLGRLAAIGHGETFTVGSKSAAGARKDPGGAK